MDTCNISFLCQLGVSLTLSTTAIVMLVLNNAPSCDRYATYVGTLTLVAGYWLPSPLWSGF
jgi:hypothetical protein